MVIAPDAPPSSPPTRRSFTLTFLGLLAVVLLVAGLTVGGYQFWKAVRPEDTGGTVGVVDETDVNPVLGPLLVRGTVTSVHLEVARVDQLAMPLEITTPERGFGAGATFEGVLIDGELASIEWDAGRSLLLSGDGGALLLDPGVIVDVSPAGMIVTLDGPVHSFTPASYRIATPVAVGRQGIAEPVDAVNFEATPDTTVTFRGTASTTVPLAPITITATGALAMDGAFSVSRGAEESTASRVTLGTGPSVMTFTLQPDGTVAVEATIEGDPEVT